MEGMDLFCKPFDSVLLGFKINQLVMTPLEKLERCFHNLKSLFKLLLKDFDNDKKHWIHTLFGCILIANHNNYIYTVAFYETEPLYLIIEVAYIFSAGQVKSNNPVCCFMLYLIHKHKIFVKWICDNIDYVHAYLWNWITHILHESQLLFVFLF